MKEQAVDSAITEFIAECEEILSRVSANLASIEKGGFSQERVDELYRDMHTMKGSAQLFGFQSIGTIAHAMETCLDPIRRTRIRPSSQLLDSSFKCVDLIDGFVKGIKSGEHKGAVATGRDPGKMATVIAALTQSACRLFGADLQFFKDVILFPEDEAKLVAATRAEGAKASMTLQPVEPLGDLVMESKQETPEKEKKENAGDAGANSGASPESSGVDTTIRVQVGLLDNLMNLIGEMVLVRNQVIQYSNRSEDLEFLKISQRLDVVTSDLQDKVMKTRMQPIGNVVGKFQRLVRELAKELGKQVDLTIQGKDTELDKTLLEAIKDPLTHIVRNACDHGIESPEERSQAGKPATGHVLISAFHEGGQVIVEISDDGKGLSRKKILKKAIENGLLSADKAESLADREILGLIFLPGFSTAEQVSAVSGRGVGMDVVRTNIEKIGGSVDLESVEGKGTTIRLRIPLTLAIVPAMLVKSGSATYAIPQVKLLELVRVDTSDEQNSGSKIKLLQGKPVYELRGKILPLVSLKQVLRTDGAAAKDLSSDSTINIVVLSTEGDIFGLIVDEVMDTADIVVKPLSKFLKSLEVYSAATILGTGEVALILDPIGVAKAAELSVAQKKQEGAFVDKTGIDREKSSDAQEYLLFKMNAPGKYAVPLCMVSRLEELNCSQIEYSGEQPVVQYRGSILPLLDTNAALGFASNLNGSSRSVPTIVVQKSGNSIGLTVDAILDVTMVDNAIDDSVKDRFGMLGNLILGKEVVSVLDVLGIVEKEMNKYAGNSPVGPVPGKKLEFDRKSRLKILHVEDVAFFRRQVAKLLASHGFDVVSAEDGQAAVELVNSPGSPDFSLILSDIEMPRMNGYQFARQARQMKRLKAVPMVALTTRFNKRDIDEGIQAGFDCYLEKLNPDVLVGKVLELLEANVNAQDLEKRKAA